MEKLLVFIKEYKKESVLAPLFKMLEALLELFVPLVIADVIDRGIGGTDRGIITRDFSMLLILAGIGLAFSITAQYFAAKAAVGFATGLRHEMFAHIEALSFTDLDQVGTSTLMTRMTSDINQLQNGVNMTLRLLLRSPFIVFGAMIMAFTVNVRAAMIFVVIIPVLFAVVFGITGITLPLYRQVQGKLDRVLGTTRENLTGVRVIRAFHREKDEIEQFQEKNQTLKEAQIQVGRISASLNPLTYLLINIATIVLLNTGAIKVNQGILTQGAIIALVNYMSQILVELVKMANMIVTLTKAIACGKRIQSVLEIPVTMNFPDEDTAEVMNNTEEAEPYIAFHQVDFRYEEAGELALKQIDFTVEKGQTVGIIGGTGSGKTTLVHLLTRFYDVSAGSVSIGGNNIRTYTRQKLREIQGIVMQKSVLFHGTIAENLRWGKNNATDEELWKALEIAQADEFVKQKEQKLEEPVRQGATNLSGGQKQRLAIARALVKNPEILILDDSASALDYATDAKLRHSIEHLKPKPTVFIVSQRAASMLQADLILVLEDGELVGKGTHLELLDNCQVYREIYESQFQDSQPVNTKEAG